MHLVDEVVSLEDGEHDPAEDGRLEHPRQHLHQEPGDAWSCRGKTIDRWISGGSTHARR